MVGITRLAREIRRRRVFRVMGLYVVFAWVALQVADLAFPALSVPESALRFVWYGAILGFLVALVISWRFDIEGGRVLRTPDSGDDAGLPLSRADYIILTAASAIIIAITGGLAVEILKARHPLEYPVQPGHYDPASIAVLPFVNMSPDPDNTYFADGLSEELLNGLANVEGLKVIARTSSFSFKGQEEDIREIGQKLSVANILEGSVRVAGDTIRVTAQLIDTGSGAHRWSETYDRPRSDIFSVQDDISRNIIASLKGTLVAAEGPSPSTATTENLEAYSHYLRGRALLRRFDYSGEREGLERALEQFTVATELDPGFSDAFVGLADACDEIAEWYMHRHMESERAEYNGLAMEAARIALQLAPQSSEANRALGSIIDDPENKERALRRAIELSPNNAAAHADLGRLLRERGILDEGAKMAREAYRLDPLSPSMSWELATVLIQENRLKEASIFFRLSAEQLEPDARADLSEEVLEPLKDLPSRPVNLEFEDDTMGWSLDDQACIDNYVFSSSDLSHSGQYSGRLASLPGAVGWCGTIQSIFAGNYRGSYIRLSGMLRTRSISESARLWMIIHADGFRRLGFADGSPDFIREDRDWVEYDVRLYVPEDAWMISFGAVLDGSGELWTDSFRIEVSDSPNFD